MDSFKRVVRNMRTAENETAKMFLRVGDPVEVQNYGRGVVLEIARTRVMVSLDKNGKKGWIAARAVHPIVAEEARAQGVAVFDEGRRELEGGLKALGFSIKEPDNAGS